MRIHVEEQKNIEHRRREDMSSLQNKSLKRNA